MVNIPNCKEYGPGGILPAMALLIAALFAVAMAGSASAQLGSETKKGRTVHIVCAPKDEYPRRT